MHSENINIKVKVENKTENKLKFIRPPKRDKK